MKTGRGWWALAGVGLLTLLGLYVGAYYANLIGRDKFWFIRDRDGTKMCFTAEYRVCPSASERLFAPMYNLDRRLRPSMWTLLISPADPQP